MPRHCQNLLAITVIAACLVGCRTDGTVRFAARSVDGSQPAAFAEAQPSAVSAECSQTKSRTASHPIRLIAGESEPEPIPVPHPAPAPFQLTLSQAIETGLAQNPDLVTQRQAERVNEAAVEVAQTYPFNPSVQVQATPYQNSKEGTTGTTYHYVLLMQQIQLAHQQRYREAGACAVLNSTRWNIIQAQLLNVAQTERLYFTALYQKGVHDLIKATAENNEQLLTILERQLKAGQATAADVSVVRLDVRATRKQADLAEANFQNAVLDLKRQLGLPISTPLQLTEDLTRWRWHPADAACLAAMNSAEPTNSDLPISNPDVAIASLAGCRPDVLAAHADLDAARANCEFADASRTPDLQIGPYYQRNDSGVTFVGFRAQIDLPVLNDGTPLLRQRHAELHQRVIAWQELQTRAELEARAALDRYERARRLIAATASDNDATLPIELQRLEQQFQAGEVDMLRVFQARTSLIQNRRAFLDTLNELAQSAAALTAATGVPVQSLAIYTVETTEPQ
ncbi:MAG: TolC family protein [Planctomycetales bacterium]|nr:TolC family protein [Planctomycetales bacterium]